MISFTGRLVLKSGIPQKYNFSEIWIWVWYMSAAWRASRIDVFPCSFQYESEDFTETRVQRPSGAKMALFLFVSAVNHFRARRSLHASFGKIFTFTLKWARKNINSRSAPLRHVSHLNPCLWALVFLRNDAKKLSNGRLVNFLVEAHNFLCVRDRENFLLQKM